MSSANAQRRVLQLGISLIIAASVACILIPAGFRWDFANFYDAGHKALVGQISDLYDVEAKISGADPHGSMAFWGVPVSSYLYAPLALFPPSTALIAFKIQNVLATFAGLLLLFFFARPFAGDSDAARSSYAVLFVILVLLFQPLWTIYRVGGQTTPTVFLLLVVGLLWHLQGRFALSSLCFVIAVLIKPTFGTGLAFLALISGLGFLGATVLWTALVAVASLVLMGPEIHSQFLARMADGSGKSTAWMHNSALYVSIENVRLLTDASPTASSRPAGLSLLILAIRLGVVFFFGWVVWKARAERWTQRARRHFYFTLGILFGLLVAPIAWEHYLTLLFIPLAYWVAVRRYLSLPALWLIGLIFLFSVGQNLVLIRALEARFAFDTLAELLAIGLFKSAPLILTLVLLWRHHDELFESYRAPAWNAG